MTSYSPSQHLCCAVSDPCPKHAPISGEIARHVLWHFGADGGYAPGSFTRSLIHTIACADPINAAKLAAAFPGYVVAVGIAQTDEGGIAILQRIAGGEQ